MWAITKKRLRIFTRSKMLETAKIYGIILSRGDSGAPLMTIVDDNGVLLGMVVVMVAAGKKTGDPNTSP